MRIIDYISMAMSNLKKRKLRTFITTFAVAIGVIIIVVMLGFGTGLQQIVVKQMSKLDDMYAIQVAPYKNINIDDEGINSEGERKKITGDVVEKIKNIENVEEIYVHMNSTASEIKINDKKLEKQITISGVDMKYSDGTIPEAYAKSIREKEKDSKLKTMAYGYELKKENTDGVVIGEKLLKDMGFKKYDDLIGKTIEFKLKKNPLDNGKPEETVTKGNPVKVKVEEMVVKGRIVGISNEKFGDSTSVPIEMTAKMQEFYTDKQNYYEEMGPDTLNVYSKSYGDVAKISEKIEKEIGYGTMSMAKFTKIVDTVFGTIKIVLAALGGIVIFVAIIGVVNTMIMSVHERTMSIGIMKATGAARMNIRKLFMIEASLIGFWGSVIGIGICFVIKLIGNYAINEYLKTSGLKEKLQFIDFPIWLIAGVIIFSMIVTLLAGVLPAMRAAKLDPIESLRYE